MSETDGPHGLPPDTQAPDGGAGGGGGGGDEYREQGVLDEQTATCEICGVPKGMEHIQALHDADR
jgi:hypothetical protein